MATTNKAITTYLPSFLEESLTQYCTEYNITRKDKSGELKPALGTGIVEVLKVFFSNEDVPSPLSSDVPGTSLSQGEVEKIVNERLSDVFEQLKEIETRLGKQKP